MPKRLRQGGGQHSSKRRGELTALLSRLLPHHLASKKHGHRKAVSKLGKHYRSLHFDRRPGQLFEKEGFGRLMSMKQPPIPAKGVALLDNSDDSITPHKSSEVMSVYCRHHEMNEGWIVCMCDVLFTRSDRGLDTPR